MTPLETEADPNIQVGPLRWGWPRRGGNFLVVVDTVCRFERVEDWVGWVSTTRVLELSDLIDAAVTDKWMVFQLTLQAKVCMEHV